MSTFNSDNRFLLRLLKETLSLSDVDDATEGDVIYQLSRNERLTPMTMCRWSRGKKDVIFYSDMNKEYNQFLVVMSAKGLPLLPEP